MPPGSETSRYSGRFGENVLRHGRHKCLPYCRNRTCSKIYKHQFVTSSSNIPLPFSPPSSNFHSNFNKNMEIPIDIFPALVVY